jgi:hypothetical protein
LLDRPKRMLDRLAPTIENPGSPRQGKRWSVALL